MGDIIGSGKASGGRRHKGETTMNWIIDATIDLTQICENAAWHLATAIDALVASGLSRQDAEAFAGFAFREHAKVGDGKPEDFIDDAQYERLTLAKG
jgi:hypothetical protein